MAIFALYMGLCGKFIPKFSSICCFTLRIAIIFIFFIAFKGYGQGLRGRMDTVSARKGDSISLKANPAIADSITVDTTAFGKDTSKKATLEAKLGIKISKDAMPSVVTAYARDSAVLNMKANMFYLYGKAKTNYEDMQVTAGQITYNQSSSVITAAPLETKGDTASDKQTFTQGKEKFTYDSMQYNFRSKRAIVRNVHSQYGEGYVHSEQVKRNPDQSIYGAHSIYTTCALDTPHFGIVASRIKMVPGRVIVSGPANLQIEGVPTPLFLPFGIFPVSQKQKSGFIMPTYTIEQNRGLGLLNGGYYFYINDHVDLQARANIFSKGSYGLSGASEYRNNYHYSGGLNVSYAYNKTGEDFEPGAYTTKDFMVNWRHRSDAKAVPGQSFNASVQAGTSNFYSNNSYDPGQILQNQYQSNISYAKNWQNKPFGLTVSALHNQNTVTKQVSVSLPNINFYVSQVNPFQRRNAIGSHWYDKITTSYTMDLLNRTTFYDSAFQLARLSLGDFQSGISHKIPVSATYTILRYFQMSFNVSYKEYWLTNKLYQNFNDVTQRLDSVNSNGFYTARDFNTGVNFSTRIYGQKMFKNGKLRGIRHVINPSAGFSYHPDFAASPYNYYYRTRIDSTNTYVLRTPFVNSIIGYPQQGRAGQINYGLGNNLQIKVRTDKDTVSGYKNITLIDGLSLGGSYNLAADSFQWSPVGVNFRTNIMDNINISSSAVFDPYGINRTTGRNFLRTLVEQGNGLVRFTHADASLGSNFHSKPTGAAVNASSSEEYKRVLRNAGYNEFVDFNIPWSFNINYTLSADKRLSSFTRQDTLIISHSLTFQGELQVTKNWKLNVSSGYNFDYKQATLTSIDLYRDLHCWAMHLQAYPFGPRKSYNFTLNVKSSILQDLKLLRRRDYRDAPQ